MSITNLIVFLPAPSQILGTSTTLTFAERRSSLNSAPKFQVRCEINDTALAHSQERQDLETSVTEINKELKLK